MVRPALPVRIAVLALAAAAGLSACDGPGRAVALPSASSVPADARVLALRTLDIAGLGDVLVTSTGQTLYVYKPDDHRAVTCRASSGCSAAWPPLRVRTGARLIAGPGVRAALIGTDAVGHTGAVVTYGGWPLYTYVGDSGPGQARGQDQAYLWFVMGADGRPVIHPIVNG